MRLFILYIIFCFLVSIPLTSNAQGISTLDQWGSTTTPESSITQRTYGKPLKLTGFTSLLPICIASNGFATTTGCTSSGPTIFGKSWEIAFGALSPTTTFGIIVNASSTIGNGTQQGGLTINGGATTTGNAAITGKAAVGGTLNVTGQTTLATSLTGFLKAASGVVSTALISLTTDISGILPVANGGTNAASFTANVPVIANAAGTTLVSSSTLGVAVGGTGATSFTAGNRIVVSHGTGPFTDIGLPLTVSNGGTGAVTFAASNLLYGAGTGVVQTVGTTTASCAGTASCSSFTVIGSSPVTITGAASSATDPFIHTPLYNGQTTSATSTLLRLTASPISLAASSSVLTYASSTAFSVNGSMYLTGLTGFLKAGTAGLLTSSLVSLTVDISGTLPIGNGGTNASSFGTSNALSFYDGTRLLTDSDALFDGTKLTLTSASTTNLSASGFFQVPSGTTQAPIATGALGLDTTDGQFKIGDGTATQVYTQYRYVVYPYSTTTAWAGTTTLAEFVLPDAMIFDSAQCYTKPSGGAVNAQIQYGTTPTKLAMLNASSTVGKFAFTASNTPTAGATTTISYGTPTGSPTDAICTVKARMTGT